jgi:hypothetical protein
LFRNPKIFACALRRHKFQNISAHHNFPNSKEPRWDCFLKTLVATVIAIRAKSACLGYVLDVKLLGTLPTCSCPLNHPCWTMSHWSFSG